MIVKLLVGLLFVAVCEVRATKYELLDYEPKADAAAIIHSGNARFTVLTKQLIRVEWSNSSTFEDRPTLAFLNRKLSVPTFTHVIAGGVLTIKTESVTMKYTVGKPFSVATLSATGSFGSWSYGAADTGNLLGTIKSLDELGVTSLNCTENAKIKVHDETLHCEWALISRTGWAVVDDSYNYALDENDWWAGVNEDDVDTYLFAHGHEYKQALYDYQLVGGKVAMVPRQASGLWWTRWFDLNNQDVIKVIEDYKTRTIPLDIFVLDMDWHKKNDWSGFTFDRELFPYPSDSMQAIKRSGLLLSANIHDASGVGSWEEQYAPLAKAIKFDTSGNKSIPFSMIDTGYVNGLEDIVLGVLEDKRIGGTVEGGVGMDFWWIDWQQGGTKGGCAGGKQNPTIWTNKVRCTDAKRRGTDGRNMVLARWGGLGTHRYQVGFSGDVKGLSWPNLAYQPYFSLTASNVLYGFWSHDIEGPSSDLELYTRWVQWAAYSAVFRSHERGMSGGGCADTGTCSIVKPWNVPVVFEEANRAAMQARSALLPYIYTQHRTAYDSGLSILRPMYYDFPEAEQAYSADQDGNFGQYFFGPDMFVSPVVNQATVPTPQIMGLASGKAGGLAFKKIWVPPGVWVEEYSGAVLTGAASSGTVMNRSYALDEIPVFVKAGAVVARHPMSLVHSHPVGRASEPNTALEFSLYPGAKSGSTEVYEDDGETTAYVGGAYAFTTCAYTATATSTTATISLKHGSKALPSLPSTRAYSLRLVNAMPPKKVSCNGVVVPYARWGGAGTWKYDGEHTSVVVECPPVGVDSPLKIDLDTTAGAAALSGVAGMLRRANAAKVNLDVTRQTPGAHTPVKGGAKLKTAASLGQALSFVAGKDATDFNDRVDGYKALFAAAIAEVKGMQKINAARKGYSQALLESY